MLKKTKFNVQLLPALFLCTLFVLALKPVEAFDTFWQLQSGKHIWQTGKFIYEDTFSLASTAFRLEHCWLSDLIFYAFYFVGGYPFLSLLKAFVVTLCGTLLFYWNKKKRIDLPMNILVLTICIVASEPSWLVRPQLWTFLFSLIYLNLLYLGRKQGLKAWLWLVPVMLLWANLHAGCLFGIVQIGLFFCGETVRLLKERKPLSSLSGLFIAGLLTLGVSFINPYGYRIPLKLFSHVNLHNIQSIGQLGVMEWLPPTFAQVPAFYIIITSWGLFCTLRLRRLDPVEAVYFAALLYMGMSQIRHTTLAVFLSAFFLPAAIQDKKELIGKGPISMKLLEKNLNSLVIILLFGLLVYNMAEGSIGVGLKKEQFPVAATDFLIKNRLPGNLYNSYDWGGYLMWRLYPEYLVFVDGRTGSLEMFNASTVIDNTLDGWDEILNKYEINTVITRTCYYDTGEPISLVFSLIDHKDWAPVYSDGVAVIFVRKTRQTQEIVKRQALSRTVVYRTVLAEASRLYNEDSSRTKAFLTLGRTYLKLGDYKKAAYYYGKYRQAEPNDTSVKSIMRILERYERLPIKSS